MDIIQEFKSAMASNGIVTNDDLLANGLIQRFFVEGGSRNSKSGWAVIYPEARAGAYGCWRAGSSFTWAKTPEQDMSSADRAIFYQKIAFAKSQQEVARKEAHKTAQEEALKILNASCDPRNDHPYLLSKKISACNGLRLGQDQNLLIPLRDIEGELHTLQFVSGDGKKRFLRDGLVKGNFFEIGELTDVIYIGEGYATCASIYQATQCRTIVAFNSGNLSAVAHNIRMKYPGHVIIIAADNDQFTEGNPGLKKATEAANLVNAKVLVPDFSGLDLSQKPTDFNDLFCLSSLDILRKQLIIEPKANDSALYVIGLKAFLALDLPPRELILWPWLPKGGLCMIHARPGIGKTHLSFGIAYAVATGSSFLKWRAEKPRGVLLIDGEMPATAAQERFANIIQMNPSDNLPAPLNFLTPDLQTLGMPDLATVEGQKQVGEHINDEIDLIIVDNLSCLVRTGKENDSESWQPVQTWALNLRARGKSVLFIHHQGKTGSQRGSSKKEDVLDTVISLKRPENYTQEQGACFVVSFEKSRGFHGEEAKSFEAALTIGQNGKLCWVVKDLEESTFEKVVELINSGVPQKDICGELNVSKGTVSKYVARARNEGLIKSREMM